jgi:hypothetical protein
MRSLGGADNAFTFIGNTALTGIGGELRYRILGSDTLIEGNVDTGGADFQIAVTGIINFTAADFQL